MPAPAAVDATPEQLGRPPVPTPTPATVLRGFVLALVVAEAFFFSGPILAAQGVDPARIVEALSASPVPVGMALVFALGAAASVFAFAKVSLERAAQLDGARARAPGVSGAPRRIVAALLAGGVAAAATKTSRIAHVALLAVVPFAGALLLRAAARLQTARDAALEAALAWDRALAVDVSERARRMEIVEQARAEVDTARGRARRLAPPGPRARAARGERGPRRLGAHPPRGAPSRAPRRVARGRARARSLRLPAARDRGDARRARPPGPQAGALLRAARDRGVDRGYRASTRAPSSIASVGCCTTRSPGASPEAIATSASPCSAVVTSRSRARPTRTTNAAQRSPVRNSAEAGIFRAS